MHPKVMIARERYKWVPPETLNSSSFTRSALLDFDPETEQHRTAARRDHMERILAAKDIENLAWIGDKYPGYLGSMQTLATTNPGCRFIMTHRGIDAVVNSYVGRSRNPLDSWLGGRDLLEVVDLAINTWNRSLGQILEAIRTPDLDVLVVPYDDFHADPVTWAVIIGDFLDLDMPAALVAEWQRRSEGHLSSKGTANVLSDDLKGRIALKANHALETELLAAIEPQLGGDSPKGPTAKSLRKLFGR